MERPSESKRVKNFRLEVAKAIPKFPNDKATLESLKKMSVGELLIHAANWLIRYVRPAPRTVQIEPAVKSDPRWARHSNEINALLRRVETGEELTSYLSRKPHTKGYTPAASQTGVSVDRWADKDMILNVMGYHHLHLVDNPPSDLMIFAQITRTEFDVVTISDHSVFEQTGGSTAGLTQERQRLWTIFEERSMRGAPPGAVIVPALIATSGHPFYVSRLAQDYARVVQDLDPKLDDPEYVRKLYSDAGWLLPKNPKLEWYLHYLDFGLYHREQRQFFVCRYGPN